MIIIAFAIKHSIEIFFTALFAVGAKWARPFLDHSDWNEKVEMMIDFVIIVQGWIIAPLLIVSQCIGSMDISSTASKEVAIVTIFVMSLGLLRLAIWRRVGFFSQEVWLQWMFRLAPVAMLSGKLLIEFLEASGVIDHLKAPGV